MSANIEPIRPPRHPRGNDWQNSGVLKRKFRGEVNASKRAYQAHMRKIRSAKVSKRLRDLLDGGSDTVAKASGQGKPDEARSDRSP